MITRDLWPDEIVDDMTSGRQLNGGSVESMKQLLPLTYPSCNKSTMSLITGEDFRVILQEIHMGSLSLAFSDRCSALRCYLVESIGLSFGHSLRLLWQECKLEAP